MEAPVGSSELPSGKARSSVCVPVTSTIMATSSSSATTRCGRCRRSGNAAKNPAIHRTTTSAPSWRNPGASMTQSAVKAASTHSKSCSSTWRKKSCARVAGSFSAGAVTFMSARFRGLSVRRVAGDEDGLDHLAGVEVLECGFQFLEGVLRDEPVEGETPVAPHLDQVRDQLVRVRVTFDHAGQRAADEQMALVDGDVVLQRLQTDGGADAGRAQRHQRFPHDAAEPD